ncbi:hypothetical protein POM88_052056 [Heracleum sosnowskyi]|uniref:NPH3 domain-containing protein n=1 Tax=Heracleum sosnowskyi TaxID=360622 RepID=A0AAD8GSB4_9APIA|nr:hypothetical protein POM88_052056 [Heracleum sosnowskyi]
MENTSDRQPLLSNDNDQTPANNFVRQPSSFIADAADIPKITGIGEFYTQFIVSRCIESLAFMACMEILDPERRRDQPVVTLEALASQAWSLQIVEEIVDVWIKDLIALPFRFFERIIKSLRRQAFVEDFLLPTIEKGSFSSSFELATMESIISSYVSVNIGSNNTPLPSKSIATDPAISFKRFMDLIEIVPMSIRQNHDYLYRALNTFLQGHLDLSEEEREMICKDLKCQKIVNSWFMMIKGIQQHWTLDYAMEFRIG